MNSIRDSIAKSEIVNSSPNLGIQGATGLMSAISSCMASFNGMTAILYDKIKQETEATMSIAQGIIYMDRNVAENAEQSTESSEKQMASLADELAG